MAKQPFQCLDTDQRHKIIGEALVLDGVLACSHPSPTPYCLGPCGRSAGWDRWRMSSFTAMVEENSINMGCNLGFGIGFIDMTPKAQATKEKIGQWDFIKILNFCAQRTPSRK